jgi:phosphonate transport system substrate-binding protein
MRRKIIMRSIFDFIVLLLLIFISISSSGCSREAEEVSLTEVETEAISSTDTETLKIAVSAIISPKKTFIYYREILDFIAEKTGANIELVQRRTYAEVNNLIKDNSITAAFVCSGAYVDGHREFGMEILAAPEAYGKPYYHSYIIVPADSDIKTLEDLRGKSFAFTDPMSNTGKLAPTYMLVKLGETPEHFFSNIIFTYSHDKSIEAVSQKLVDGAAVDSLIWDYADATNPEMSARTRIISKSPPYGIPPVVVPKELDPAIKGRLREVLLNMHKSDKGMGILDKVKIDRFVEIEDKAYDSIRDMRNFIDEYK